MFNYDGKVSQEEIEAGLSLTEEEQLLTCLMMEAQFYVEDELDPFNNLNKSGSFVDKYLGYNEGSTKGYPLDLFDQDWSKYILCLMKNYCSVPIEYNSGFSGCIKFDSIFYQEIYDHALNKLLKDIKSNFPLKFK